MFFFVFVKYSVLHLKTFRSVQDVETLACYEDVSRQSWYLDAPCTLIYIWASLSICCPLALTIVRAACRQQTVNSPTLPQPVF